MARAFRLLQRVSEYPESLAHLRRSDFGTWCGRGIEGWRIRPLSVRIVCAECRERAQEMGYR
jgi:hypothetical protein